MAHAATAQEGISVGYRDVGVVIGVGSIGEAGAALGGRLEFVTKQLPDLGDGMLGFRFGIDWYAYSIGAYDWTYTPLSATANYHFKMENKKVDPFIGAGLGYYVVSEPTGYPGSWNSGLYVVTILGVRYFLNDTMAFIADAGAGAGALHVGLAWKF